MCVCVYNGITVHVTATRTVAASRGAAVFKLMNRPIPFIARPSRQQKPRESAASVVGSKGGGEATGRALCGNNADVPNENAF